jgi:hypothetical protein
MKEGIGVLFIIVSAGSGGPTNSHNQRASVIVYPRVNTIETTASRPALGPTSSLLSNRCQGIFPWG